MQYEGALPTPPATQARRPVQDEPEEEDLAGEAVKLMVRRLSANQSFQMIRSTAMRKPVY